MSSRVRVIVATYEQLPYLRLALRGYLRQSTSDFHLTVADDGSSAPTRDFLARIRPEFEERGIGFDVVWQEDRGFRKTAILNEAVRRAGGERLFLFSDGDCIPPARFVERHLAAHEDRSLHVAGSYRLSRETSEALTPADVDSGRYETLGSDADRCALRHRRRQSRWGTLVRRRNRPKVIGLNFAIDRALLEEINGFDERFRSYGIGEDTDIGNRAMRTRPRPRVKNLYLENDVYHLWHRPTPGGRAASLPYYRTKRPLRCVDGLVREAEAPAPAGTRPSPDPVGSKVAARARAPTA